MSFEIVEPGQWAPRAPLAEGECSLDRKGNLVLREQDLAGIGVKEPWVVALASPSDFRVAVRAVRADERQMSIAVQVITRKGQDSHRRRIGLGRAIRRCGISTESVGGERYTLRIKDDQLLIVHLTEHRPKGGGQAGK